MVGMIYLPTGESYYFLLHVLDSDMFMSRMGKSSKVTRSIVRNSCAPLSDAEPTVVESDSRFVNHVPHCQIPT